MQGSYFASTDALWLGVFSEPVFPENYQQGKVAMKALQEHARQADQELLELTGAQDLVKSEGCLGLFATEEGFCCCAER